MSKSDDRLCLRASLIEILNKYRNIQDLDRNSFEKDLIKIANFSNQQLVSSILLKEFSTKNSFFLELCKIIAIEALDDNAFEIEAIKFLRDTKIDDNIKMIVLSVLHHKNIDFDYADFVDSLDEPTSFAQREIDIYMQNSLTHPEIQIDLIDFYLNISQDERMNFLATLSKDLESDNMANAFSLLIQVQDGANNFAAEKEIILNALMKSNSPYSLYGLEFAKAYYANSADKLKKIERQIKKNKLKYPNFINSTLLNGSKPSICFIGFVDGLGDFSIVFSRLHDDKKITASLLTINIKTGINSCINFFKIDKREFLQVIERVYEDVIPAKISPNVLKSIYEHYKNINLSQKIALPYEAIVVSNLMNDVDDIENNISQYINSKLEVIKLTKDKLLKLINVKLMHSWFYSFGECIYVDKIIKNIEDNKIADAEIIDKLVDEIINNEIMKDDNFISELKSKLLMQSYISHLANLKTASAYTYSLCHQDDYLKIFINSIIDKSIYSYLNSKIQNLAGEKNIFKKEKPSNLSDDEIELILAQLEEKWK